MKYIFVLALLIAAMIGCESMNTKHEPEIAPPPPVIASEFKLSWEKKDPRNAVWSIVVYDAIKEHFDSFDKAKDAKRICPKYETMPEHDRIIVWAELISAMAKFESNWEPTSRMKESSMGTDPVTKQPVHSEGLMQMSYQDIPNYKFWLGDGWCGFDWSKDKGLAPKDPRKTILDPKINLECAIKVLANQIDRTGYVILSKGVYWAVIKDGGRYSKIPEITSMVQQVGGCK